MQIIDPAHPFYRPLYRRVLVTLVAAGWALFEIYIHEWFWIVLSVALTALSVYELLWKYSPVETPTASAPPSDKEAGGDSEPRDS